jgi:hypothetical protein
MADISDVTSALVSLIAAAVYPSGTSQPPVAGAAVKIFEGWPVPQQLDADMALGTTTQVSVFPLPGEQPTSRYLNDGESVLSISAPKLSLSVALQAITLSGVIPAASDRHTLVAEVNGRVYTYVVQASDTLTGAAAGLAAAINVDPPGASSSGAVVTVAGAARIGGARVAVTGQYARDVRRQNRPVQITVWAPTPQLRSAIASAIDVALADTRFLTLADQKARMVYRSSLISDRGQKDRAWRRDLIYAVDFGTTVVKTTTTVAAESFTVTAQGPDQAVAPTPMLTLNL